MDLVRDHVVELEHIHNTDSDAFFEWLTSETIVKFDATIAVEASLFELLANFVVLDGVEGWSRYLVTKCASCHTKVSLKELTEVHAAWHAHWVEQDVDWSTVFHEWHILNWENTCDDTLVTVATSELIADANLAHFSNVNLNLHNDAGLEFVALFASINTNTDDLTAIRTVHTNGSIADVLCLFTEDCAKEAFLRAKLLFALWRNLTDEHIAVLHFGTDSDDTVFAEVAEGSFTDVWNITSNLFWTKLGFADLDIEVADIDAGQSVVFDKAARNDDSVIHVITAPWHEGDKHVLTKSQFATGDGCTLDENVTLFDLIATLDDDTLIITAVIIGLHEVNEVVSLRFLGVLNLNRVGISLYDFTSTFGVNDLREILCDVSVDTGRNDSGFWLDKRYGLLLHGACHEGAVDTVLFNKWNHRCGHTENFFVNSVHVGNFARHNLRWAEVLTSGNIFINEFAILVELSTGIGNYHVFLGSGIYVYDFIGNLTVLNDAVWSFDEAVIINTSVGSKVQHETDVATFWRLNRTDTTVVGWVSIADIEACAFTSKTTRTHRA